MKRLTVNALGEVFWKGDYMVGYVNVAQLAERLGREPNAKDYKREFARQLREELPSVKARRLVHTCWRLQVENDGRFRIWVANGRLVMSTEFCELVADRRFWRLLKDCAKRLGAEYDVMMECPHSDHVIHNSGKSNERHVYGPKHGKPERQVDLRLSVKVPTLRHVRELKRRVAVMTESFWNTAGVSVI